MVPTNGAVVTVTPNHDAKGSAPTRAPRPVIIVVIVQVLGGYLFTLHLPVVWLTSIQWRKCTKKNLRVLELFRRFLKSFLGRRNVRGRVH